MSWSRSQQLYRIFFYFVIVNELKRMLRLTQVTDHASRKFSSTYPRKCMSLAREKKTLLGLNPRVGDKYHPSGTNSLRRKKAFAFAIKWKKNFFFSQCTPTPWWCVLMHTFFWKVLCRWSQVYLRNWCHTCRSCTSHSSCKRIIAAMWANSRFLEENKRSLICRKKLNVNHTDFVIAVTRDTRFPRFIQPFSTQMTIELYL